jgi:uncharacterized membrane protein YhiD involved in acid resistance
VLENLHAVNVFSPSVAEILINVIVSLFCSYIVSLIYKFTYRGPGYAESFVDSIVFLSVITTLVIMIIGNNLARAFGLVGALSIIRFRTAVKDTIDIVYIFLSLAIGMASGVGYHKLSIIGTITMGIIFIVFANNKISGFMQNQYILKLCYSNGEPNENSFLNVLLRFCTRVEVVNIASNEIDNSFDYSYYIRLKKNQDINILMHDLKEVKGVRSLNVFYDQQNS